MRETPAADPLEMGADVVERGIDWMPGQPRPLGAAQAASAKTLEDQMERAYQQLRQQRVRSAGGVDGVSRHRGLVCVSSDGDQLMGDGCNAAQLSTVDPESLEEVTEVSLSEATLGMEGCAMLSEWISGGCMPDLENLDLSCSDVGAEGARVLARSLLKGAPRLEVLRLDGAFRQEEGALESLAELMNDAPRLRELSMFSCYIDDVGALVLAQGLVNSRSLQQLHLDWNAIGPEGAAALAEAMRGNSALRRLDLTQNRVVDVGACTLLGMLPRCPRLQHLGLGGNGIRSLAAAPQDSLSSPGLRTLVLSDNHLNVPGAAGLAKLLPGSRGLTALYLANNQLGDDGTCVLLAALTEHQSTVRCVDLARNGISPAGAAHVADCVADDDCQIIRLDLTGNPLGDDGWAVVRDAVPRAVSLRWLTLRACGIADAGTRTVLTDRGYRCRVDIRDAADGSDDEDSDEST
eukprot:TRINITY_DN11138_c0_g1_i1.p1 TRINITY_DN11138_c0_g1~~TRINITY_DN11138_c0_g1_i1.p1  ORF type:complete len:463 (+),score=136.48 TRINITY_DN11138_c0_g1_i1:45-1433(+)